MWTLHDRRSQMVAIRAGVGVVMVAALSVAVVGATSGVSSAGRHRPEYSALKAHPHRQRVNHSNTGATHSPRVLRELAGWAGTSKHGRRGASLPGALQGVDVASYQHPGGQSINWHRVAKSGVQFVAVKATEGAYYRNPFALTDLAQAKAAGLSVMAYVFAIPNGNGGSASPVAQADYLIKYLAAGGGQLPPIMLDIEYNPYGAECYGLSQAAMVSWVAQFSGEVQAKTGEDPVIYGPGPWWQDCTGGTARFGQFPLWVPDYTSAPRPLITHGWSNYAFWQYSSAGTVRGINAPGNTDLDQLNPAVIPLLDPGSQDGVAGGTVALPVALADPVKRQTVSFAAAGLPPGTSISPTGEITGWPLAPGTYHPTVSASDSAGQSGSVAFTWTVAPGPSAGPTGPVQLVLGSECLTAAGNELADGTQAEIRPCTGSSAQAWTYAPDNTLRIGNKCLTIAAAAQGALAELEPCASTAVQQWRLVYPRAVNPALGSRRTALVNLRSGMCLADPGFSTASRARMELWPCNGYANEAWTLPPGPVTSQIAGMCLDDSGNQSANGTKVVISGCNGSTEQAWLAETDGTVRINGKCLDVQHGATASGSPVDLYSCNGTQAQQWNLVPDGAGVTLMNPASRLCLADPGDATAAGTQLVINACVTGDPGLAWRVS
jgi:GH25 family lysozyme M1 (1,4-beta-N-acetylmuramidase)